MKLKLLISICVLALFACATRNINDYLEKGNKYYNDGNLELAIKAYSTALEIDPKNQDALYFRAISFISKKDYDLGIIDYRTLIKNNSRLFDSYYGLGIAYNEKGSFDKSICFLDTALKLDSTISLAYFWRGNSKMLDRKTGSLAAIQDYNKALTLDSTYDEIYSRRATCYSNIKKYNFAMNDYNTAVRLNPKNGYTYMSRASLYIALGEKKDAIKDYKKAAELGIVGGSNYLKELYNIDYPTNNLK